MKQIDDLITLHRDVGVGGGNKRTIIINRRDIILIEPYADWSKVTVARWQFVQTYSVTESKKEILKMIEEADNK